MNQLLTFLLLSAILLPMQARVCLGDAVEEARFNRVVVILDRSASFANHLEEARDLAWKYIRDLGNTSPTDEVYVVGVDHMPSHISYIRGVRSRRDAEGEFAAAFAHPTDGLGTDWVTAFHLAAMDFNVPPKASACHLLVFGDLCVDDQKNPSTLELLREFDRLADFDWGVFSRAKVSMWFVDERVRQQLFELPSFSGLGARVHAIESRAMARDIGPPTPIAPDSSAGTNMSLWVGYGGGILVVLALIGLIFRKRGEGTRQ